MTRGEISAILQKHRLHCPSDKIARCGAGFRHEVWFAGDCVVKHYGDKARDYGRELWFYKTAAPAFAPSLVAHGENYIILKRIRGTGLFRKWRGMGDAERRAMVGQIARIACDINNIPLSGSESFIDFPRDWREHVLTRIGRDIEKLLGEGGIPTGLAGNVKRYAHENSGALDDSDLFLVHDDLHFDNIIVSDGGRIYLVDYEMLRAAPHDFVLDVWQRMLIHPFVYANEEDHPLTLPGDYANIMNWMREYASELFSHPRVRERVNIYGIMYELEILRDYPMGDWPLERLGKYINGVSWD